MTATTARVLTHTPTGDMWIVQQLDLRDMQAIVYRVLAHDGARVTRCSDAKSLPLADCAPVRTVKLDAATLSKLWRSGVTGDARDKGRDVVIARKRNGGFKATMLKSVADAEAERDLVNALAPAVASIVDTLGTDRDRAALRAIVAQADAQVADAKHRAALRQIDAAASQGPDALLALATSFADAGAHDLADLALSFA